MIRYVTATPRLGITIIILVIAEPSFAPIFYVFSMYLTSRFVTTGIHASFYPAKRLL